MVEVWRYRRESCSSHVETVPINRAGQVTCRMVSRSNQTITAPKSIQVACGSVESFDEWVEVGTKLPEPGYLTCPPRGEIKQHGLDPLSRPCPPTGPPKLPMMMNTSPADLPISNPFLDANVVTLGASNTPAISVAVLRHIQAGYHYDAGALYTNHSGIEA